MSNLDDVCPMCRDGYPVFILASGERRHEALGFSWSCWNDHSAAHEKEQDLRDQIANGGC